MAVLGTMPPFLALVVRLFAMLALAVLVVTGSSGSASGQQLQATEYRVKAAFIFKFGDYVEWPAETFRSPDSPLVVGVLGADAIADELARVSAGRTVGGRPVTVRKLRHGEPLSGLHMIFIGRTSRAQLAAALAASKGQPALTIAEAEDGLRLGSMINFVIVSEKIRFDVALPPVEASRLKISSRLLAVARNVVASVP